MDIKSVILLTAPIENGKEFHSEISSTVEKMQSQNLEVEVQYQFNTIGYSILVLGRERK